MKKTKLFFVACWALMLAIQAHATAVEGNDEQPNSNYSSEVSNADALTVEEMRGMLIQMLVDHQVYNRKNAIVYVHTLTPEEVLALLQSSQSDNLLHMTDNAAGIRPIQPTLKQEL